MDSNLILLLYGLVIGHILTRIFNEFSSKGNSYGECPFCGKTCIQHYETMWECENCHKVSTNDELKDKDVERRDKLEKEQELEFKKIHNKQVEEEYKEKLEDLSSEYLSKKVK